MAFVGAEKFSEFYITLHYISRIHSNTFYSSLKTILCSHAGNWIEALKICYINLRNEWMNWFEPSASAWNYQLQSVLNCANQIVAFYQLFSHAFNFNQLIHHLNSTTSQNKQRTAVVNLTSIDCVNKNHNHLVVRELETTRSWWSRWLQLRKTSIKCYLIYLSYQYLSIASHQQLIKKCAFIAVHQHLLLYVRIYCHLFVSVEIWHH